MPWPKWIVILSTAALVSIPACDGGRRAASNAGSLEEQFQNALQLTNAESRATRLIQVALRQNRARDVGGAERSLEAAGRACTQIDNALGRAMSLNRLAEAYGRMGMRSASRSALAKVRDALGQVDSAERSVAILARMGMTYGQYLDDEEAAKSALAQAESRIETIEGPPAKIRGLTVVAYANSRLRRDDESARLIDEATRRAREIPDPRQRSDAVREVAAALSQMSQTQQALALFDESIEAARSIDDNVSQAHALADIAIQLAKAKQKDKARKLLAEAEGVGDRIGDRGLHREVMEKIARGRAAL